MFKRFNMKRLAKPMLMLCISLLAVFAFATPASADNKSIGDDFTFYKVSSAASAYYDTMVNPKFQEENKGEWNDKKYYPSLYESKINVGQAGNFVGFLDEDYEDGFFGAATSFLSFAEQSHSYDAYLPSTPIHDYVMYGHALAEIGFDKTSKDDGLGFIIRAIGGGLLFLFYGTALSVDWFMMSVLSMLKTLNPFQFFADAKALNFLGGAFDNGFDANSGLGMALSGVVDFMSGMYDLFYDLGWFMIPLFLAGLFVTLIWRTGGNTKYGGDESSFSKIRRYATRVLFIGLGIPMLGMSYTATLDTLIANSEFDTGTGNNANYILASTLVDFESWVENAQLGLPNGAKIVVDFDKDNAAGDVNYAKTTEIRALARYVNQFNQSLGILTVTESTDLLDWNQNAMEEDKSFDKSSVSAGFDLITRYMSSETYTSSDYETSYKSLMSTSKEDVALGSGPALNGAKIYAGIQLTSDVEAFYNMVDINVAPSSSFNAKFANQYKDVALNHLTNNAPSLMAKRHGEGYVTYTGTHTVKPGTNDFKYINGGLSPLSMYNYLNTTFEDTSISVTSPHKATSALVKESHFSVNLIGNGLMSFLYYINSLSIFFTITVLGFGYAFAMIFANISRTFKVLSAMPMSMMGALPAMARITTVVIMMIIEIIGTFFMYSLSVSLLMALSAIVETPLSQTVTNNPLFYHGTTGIAGSLLVTLAFLLITTIINIVFTFKALSLRKSVVKTMDEWMASWVDRLFDPSGGTRGAAGLTVNAPKEQSAMSRNASSFAGGLTAGVGALAGQQLMAKGIQSMDTKSGVGGTVYEDGPAGASGTEGDDIVNDGDDYNTSTSNAQADNTGKALLASDASTLSGVVASGGDITNIDNDSNSTTKEVDTGISNDTDNVTNAKMSNIDADVENKSAKELKEDEKMAEMTGSKSAVESMRDDETKKAIKKEANKDKALGGVKAAVGATAVAAGAYTGNAEMTKEGAKMAVKGAQDMKAGSDKAKAGEAQVNKASQKRQKMNAVGVNVNKGSNVKGSNASSNSKASSTTGGSTTNVANATTKNSSSANANVKSSAVNNSSSKVVGGNVNVNAKKSLSGTKTPTTKANVANAAKAATQAVGKVSAKQAATNVAKGAVDGLIGNPLDVNNQRRVNRAQSIGNDVYRRRRQMQKENANSKEAKTAKKAKKTFDGSLLG